MEVKAVYYSFIGDAVGKKNDTVSIPEKSTVESFLRLINDSYGNALGDYISCNGSAGANLLVFVNGTAVSDYGHILNDGDEVCLFLPIAGG